MLVFFIKKKQFFYLKVPLCLSISQKNFGGIQISEPQQFSELENFGPLGAGRILADGLFI